jgi:hypothetical protein
MSIRPDDPRLAGLPQEEIDAILRPYYQAEVDAAYASKTAAYGTGGTTVNPATQGRGQFTAEQVAAIDAAAKRAGGFFSGATQDYIDQLQAGALGGGTDTLNALNTLIAQGELKPVAPDTPTTPDDQATPEIKTLSGSAANELKAILRRYGLEGLFDPLSSALLNDPTLIKNTDALFGSVRGTSQYQARFRGNIEREKKNLPFLSEAEYISQEQAYLKVNRNLGLPRGFYDAQNDWANFIANDVSPVEYSNRIQQAYNVVKNSDPEVLNQLKMLAPELQDADLAAYILDPSRSGQEIERKARAATIAAAGKTSGGMQLTAQQAESLALQGVSTQAAQQGFAQIGQTAGLFRPLQGEETITQQDILAGTFTNEQAAQQRIARRRRRRQAEFEAGGGLTATGNRNIGLTTVGQ